GRIICLDAGVLKDGKPRLVWEKLGVTVKYASPVLHEGRLYVCDETAKMWCFDAATGKKLWTHSYGRNSMGSPIWADGKIYVGAVNSEFSILRPSDNKCEVLQRQFFPSQTPGVDTEINGSPAVADGRIYFTTSEDIYCLGKKQPAAQTNS